MNDLTKLNSFGVRAFARELTEISRVEQLINWRESHLEEVPLILGGGTNFLFAGNPETSVLLNRIKGRSIVYEEEKYLCLRVGSGENWHELVSWAVQEGYGGIENLALIPGTVGAAPVQNIGAYGVEIKDVIDSVEYVDLQSGLTESRDASACAFAYRDSQFKKELKGRAYITHVQFRLTKKEHALQLDYGQLEDILREKGIDRPRPADVFQAVMQIRKAKLPDPDLLGNAGSFFKNPVIPEKIYRQLAKDFKDMPAFPHTTDMVKLPAGWLIEKCGWKGKRVGDAGVYHKQALVLVNHGNATGKEIYELAQRIKASVYASFGIGLEEEVNIVL